MATVVSAAPVLDSSAPWNEDDWQSLVDDIAFQKCTPVLGAGACAGVLPLGREIAAAWAKAYDYPFQDADNLPRVADYLAIRKKGPKYRLIEQFATRGAPDFNDPDEPHRLVADLPFRVYVTTNYDDFIVQALKRSVPPREATRAVCQWHKLHGRSGADLDVDFQPTIERPLVFHLHGTLDNVDSMVLTEDDYLEFLVCVSEEERLIPPCIADRFSTSSLLFMGYSLDDMDFKVLFRKLAGYMRRSIVDRHVSVQLAPQPNESNDAFVARARRQREYLETHYRLQKVKVYWGTCAEFAAQLRAHWEKRNGRG